VKNGFEKGPQAWCSYEYHASVVSGRNIFILATWSPNGGVNDSGHIWTDEFCWSADTPERPLSILPFIFYRSWINEDPIDLRNARVSVYMRGDQLQLDGALCYFWVHSPSTRWHLTASPVSICDCAWDERPTVLSLESNESLWHHSWSIDAENPLDLDTLLSNAVSYGFSLVGFSSEVRGKLSMAEFEISPAQ
jgi:hypothetical protein